MKKLLIWMLLVAVLAGLPAFFCCAEGAAEEPADGETAEWTVLFYLCGADLESKYGFATATLEEIRHVSYPYNMIPIYTAETVSISDMMRDIGKVNLLIETGGAKKWNAQIPDMEISVGALQRWCYDYIPLDNGQRTNSFRLLDTLSLQSMGAPETLADFIRWGAANYPARKYALVLWDHGGGAATGLCFDELFQDDVMCLYELRQALADSGVYLETVIMDACLMANIETASAISGYAHWMVASEETVPGDGSAVSDWLQELIRHPALDGEWLGRCICDKTEEKYANTDNDMAGPLLTWSVTDLTKINRVAESLDQFFRQMGELLAHNPDIGKLYARYLSQTERYGDDLLNMRSLGSLIYHQDLAAILDTQMLDEMMDAFSDAVVYISRGSGRSAAMGLAFCYPADFSDREMEIYSKNCPMPAYLAYLDAISPWKAPAEIYEKTEELPEIDSIADLQVTVEKRIAETGMPVLSFKGSEINLDNIYYRLYRLDEETGEIIKLGRTDCTAVGADNDGTLWGAEIPPAWPAIEDELCCIDLVEYSKTTHLYNIPVQINSEKAVLRCGQTIVSSDAQGDVREYDIYGVWLGYDENSRLMSRSVKPLSLMQGQDFRLLFPVKDAVENRDSYIPGRERQLGRTLLVEEMPIPAGTYYLEYELVDIFMRTMLLDKVEVYWDGQTFTFPNGFAWAGTVEPSWSRQ